MYSEFVFDNPGNFESYYFVEFVSIGTSHDWTVILSLEEEDHRSEGPLSLHHSNDL
jgi:hypothetical protein